MFAGLLTGVSSGASQACTQRVLVRRHEHPVRGGTSGNARRLPAHWKEGVPSTSVSPQDSLQSHKPLPLSFLEVDGRRALQGPVDLHRREVLETHHPTGSTFKERDGLPRRYYRVYKKAKMEGWAQQIAMSMS